MDLNQACGQRGFPTPRHEAAIGAAAQVLLFALLAATVGLGAAGWLAGLVFGAGTWVVLTRALDRAGAHRLGPANRVTLARTLLVGGVTALVAEAFGGSRPVLPLIALTAVALVLDAVDGRVARRTDTATPLGARFDMEVDAALILVLSVDAAVRFGPWVLLIGAMRYAFVVAARGLCWLGAPLPPRTGRKAVAAFQGIALLLATAPFLPPLVRAGLVLAALAALTWSFGRDVWWLYRFGDRTGADPLTGAGAPTRRGPARPVYATLGPQRIPMYTHPVPSSSVEKVTGM
ncbi:CDP-alcohol phosphatidyltransferase family protein [Streptomyces sp. NPDC059578]|uniref:CDP-alcohol phosphatidyltransferase family protein n=1 Tax=Streptomyces sp. NPDC059578 TaxID=3346874 RepID=UPI0036782D51